MSDPDTAAPAAASALEMLEKTAVCGPISHLPVWSAYTAQRIEPAVNALLEETTAAFDVFEQTHSPTWDGLMAPLERLELRAGRVLGAIAHLLSVKYSDPMQEAYDVVRPAYVALVNRLGQSRSIYRGMLMLRDGAQWSNLNQARQRIVSESIRGMERAGVLGADPAGSGS